MSLPNGPVEELADSSLLKSDSLNESMGASPIGATNPWDGYLVNGPYQHENGRRFVILTRGKYIRKTTSYARYLMEKHLKRLLTDLEEVDHINNDYRDDRLENLQVISKLANIRKSPRRKKTHCIYGHLKVNGICLVCARRRNKIWRDKTPRFMRP